MISAEAWNNLKEKFTSSNNVRVERNTITREEYEAIESERQEMINVLIELKKAYDPHNMGGDQYNNQRGSMSKCVKIIERIKQESK